MGEVDMERAKLHRVSDKPVKHNSNIPRDRKKWPMPEGFREMYLRDGYRKTIAHFKVCSSKMSAWANEVKDSLDAEHT